jgi:feruloyl-CoA synthase
LAALAPLAFDVVITGLNRDFIGVLIFPAMVACTAVLGLPPRCDPEAVVRDPRLVREVAQRLDAHGRANPASSTRVERAMLLALPPVTDRGEITDKGSINQRAVLQHREHLVTELYLEEVPPHVILVRQAQEAV